MAPKENEIISLMQEHEAIRASIKLLMNSLSSLRVPPESGQVAQLRSQLFGCCWVLRDLQYGIRRHIDLDERIFELTSHSASMESLARDHEEIQKQIDSVLQVAETCDDRLRERELRQRGSDISRAVDKIHEFFEVHIPKEDAAYEQLRKDFSERTP